jgi:Ribbon-helix-helix protein, copG family
MRRFQMMIDEELDEALGRQAAAEGVSKAELLRRYARERVKPLPPIQEDPLWELVGIAEGSPGDSASVDDVVYGPRGDSDLR